MAKLLDPSVLRDFSKGRITKSAVGPALVPQNSVANVINVDFSEVIGSAIVRKGNSSAFHVVYPFTTGAGQLVDNADKKIFAAVFMAQTFTTGNSSVGNNIIGFDLKLKKTGTPAGALRIRICGTSGGNPDLGDTVYDFSVPAANVTAAAGGQVYTFITAPIVVNLSTLYAIVLSSAVSVDNANCYDWFENTAGGYAGGEAQTSTNSGASWSTIGTDDFYFQIYINNVAGTYNEIPLGILSGTIAGTNFLIVAFQSKVNTKGVIYALISGNLIASNQQNLNATAKNRFVVLKGALFGANGVDSMEYSLDLGKTWQGSSGNNIVITDDNVIPSLLIVIKNRMLASGYSGFPSRVYFSSIVDPNATNFITWNTDPDTGDWIDINPDDGGIVTGFAVTSNLLLIFKTNAFYRLNTVNKTVDTENIFNVGAVSQEAIVNCLGLTYFYSGNGIYRTDGTFPELISRVGVQDFVDAISDKTAVYSGTDGFNVYFSIGNITIQFDPNVKQTFSNVVLKFSPRDENWTVFTYTKQLGEMTLSPVLTVPMQFYSAQYNGDIGKINDTLFNADYGLAIPYSLETQELEMGNRSHTKVISDEIVIYTKFGGEGSFEIRSNDSDFKELTVPLSSRVNVAKGVKSEGNFFIFRWQGEALKNRPILEGIYLPTVTDQGITK